ncbi:E3 ubiquitin-protein ligase RNF169-like [Arapaima gigas]
MAALSSAKSAGAAPGKTERHRGRGEAVDEARLLTQEEARCPVCSEIFLEPVTMPCRHSVCLPCFRQTVQQSTLHCCPLCRLRVSGWVRRQSRENSLVNAELWDMVRRSYPERCERRMEKEQEEAGGGAIIFRAPVHICKPGEIQQEYEKKKVEKEKGEKVSGQLFQKILEGDWRQVDGERQKKTFLRSEELSSVKMSEEKRRVQLHYVEEEGGKPKYFPDSHGVLSDSENEEPIGKRTRHLSAFVRKTRNSPASSRILQNHTVQRSRSCTDSEEDRQKNSCPLQLNSSPKTSIAYSHNAGILLSSENSRSLSAPILFPDKKHTWRGVPTTATIFVAPQAKPERSISPESNDSISEELNHFKPIVCSPCTPPKRLPDGRVVEPTIVKSTPRNLSRSLQKSTSYEASPTILQKWKQIEIDRQGSKVTSKGTITSPFTEDVTLGQSSVEKELDENCLLERRLQQEKEDRKLALKLQREFNKEYQKVDRRKVSPERARRRRCSNDV